MMEVEQTFLTAEDSVSKEFRNTTDNIKNFNSFITEISIIQKQQINGLVSICKLCAINTSSHHMEIRDFLYKRLFAIIIPDITNWYRKIGDSFSNFSP